MSRNVDDISLTINDVELVGRDLDDAGKELLRHIVDIRDRIYEKQFELAQLEVLDNAFTTALNNVAPKEEAS